MRFSVFLSARSMDPDQDGAIIQAMTDFAVVQRIVPRSFRRPYPLMMGVALREASIQRAVKYGQPWA